MNAPDVYVFDFRDERALLHQELAAHRRRLRGGSWRDTRSAEQAIRRVKLH